MKEYKIDFRTLLYEAREALNNLEGSLMDVEGYFSNLVSCTRGLPGDVEWMRSDFDTAHDELVKVHDRLNDDIESYDEDCKVAEVKWAWGAEDGHWRAVTVVLPDDLLKGVGGKDVDFLKKTCRPLFDRLKKKHLELCDPKFIALDDIVFPDLEEEDAA
jgi:hypothetical protein